MKVAVGMSGGVDSAVAALLLKKQGYDVVGYTMTLGRVDEEERLSKTKALAGKLSVGLKVVDLSRSWLTEVCGYVRRTYLAGETPNPCVRCNETVKMSLLPEAAFADGFGVFATGHYARVTGEGRLFRARDRHKDQSYFLYRVPREVLSRTLFPLGALTKDEVRGIARENSIAVDESEESQDFCAGDVKDILGTVPEKGEIVTRDGKVIGEHLGFWNYTVGMRKGLGVGGGVPYYVVDLDAANNRVIVAHRQDAFVGSFDIRSPVGDVSGEVMVKIRSAGEPKGPVKVEGGTVFCATPLSGVSPGQSAVFYRDEEVVGGGIIEKKAR